MKKIPEHSSLVKWACQGVLLLNSSLTFVKNTSQEFWHEFTEDVLRKILQFKQKIVFMLWGGKAQKLFASAMSGVKLDNSKVILEFAHPSPLSGPTWDCRHFLQVPICWDTSVQRFYTDGSCVGNGKSGATGGWAVVFEHSRTKVLYGSLPKQDIRFTGEKIVYKKNTENPATNIRAEGYAVIAALFKAFQMKVDAEIVIDLRFWIEACTVYMPSWIENGVSFTEKKNPDMLDTIWRLMKVVNVEFIHHKGHQTDLSRETIGNNEADVFANAGRVADKHLIRVDRF